MGTMIPGIALEISESGFSVILPEQLSVGENVELAIQLPTDQLRATAVQAHRTARSWVPVPVRRGYIPKANGKQRPLGIPVILDRCHQARVKNALEPEWEARFEPRSYGFRPGRCCQDAAESPYATLKGKSRRTWIVVSWFLMISPRRRPSAWTSLLAAAVVVIWLW